MAPIKSSQYKRVELDSYFDVSHIVEISYRGFPGELKADGEKSVDFWCLYYVDRGKIAFHMKDGSIKELSSGQGMFFAPFSSFEKSVAGKDGANILSVFFYCNIREKEVFDFKIRNFDTFERMILTELVNIGRIHFERHSNIAGGIKGTRSKKDTPPYIPHLIKASIELLLLRFYRRKRETKTPNKILSGQDNLTVNSAVEYMYKNVDKKLSVFDIASSVRMSESNFQTVFKKNTGQSVMSYFNGLKIEQAKIMIRKEIYSYGEIASALGFSSESYFSRNFKKIAGMTPSEYARLIYAG